MGRFRTYGNPTVGAIHSAHPVRGALRIRPGVYNSSIFLGKNRKVLVFQNQLSSCADQN